MKEEGEERRKKKKRRRRGGGGGEEEEDGRMGPIELLFFFALCTFEAVRVRCPV